jgi:hypothetical protein
VFILHKRRKTLSQKYLGHQVRAVPAPATLRAVQRRLPYIDAYPEAWTSGEKSRELSTAFRNYGDVWVERIPLLAEEGNVTVGSASDYFWVMDCRERML